MLENFVYENNRGERFEGLTNQVYSAESDLRDYAWNQEYTNDRITRLYKKASTRTIPLFVCCETEEDAIAVKNQITDMAEKDVAAMKPGKVWVGEWYMRGYVTASRKTNYLLSKRMCRIDLTITAEKPEWYREQKFVFTTEATETVTGGDYPYDYPYDYTPPIGNNRVNCEGVFDSDFRLQIYGEAVNPIVTIGGHAYGITGVLQPEQRVVIDSTAKTIQMLTKMGSPFNWFDKRNRDSYIFQPLAPGMHEVVTNGDFGVDITVIEKRSEPKWT